MTVLYVRDIPEDVMAYLRERADRNDRSVAAEVRTMLAEVKRAADAKAKVKA